MKIFSLICNLKTGSWNFRIPPLRNCVYTLLASLLFISNQSSLVYFFPDCKGILWGGVCYFMVDDDRVKYSTAVANCKSHDGEMLVVDNQQLYGAIWRLVFDTKLKFESGTHVQIWMDGILKVFFWIMIAYFNIYIYSYEDPTDQILPTPRIKRRLQQYEIFQNWCVFNKCVFSRMETWFYLMGEKHRFCSGTLVTQTNKKGIIKWRLRSRKAVDHNTCSISSLHIEHILFVKEN